MYSDLFMFLCFDASKIESCSQVGQINVTLTESDIMIILAMMYDKDYYNTMKTQMTYKFRFYPTKEQENE